MHELYNNQRALIFGKNFPVVVVSVIGLISLLSSVSNWMLGITHPLNWIGFGIFLVSFLLLLIGKTKEYLHVYLLLAVLIYCPCVFIITDGFKGSNPLFAVVGVFLFVALYSERIRWYLVSLECVIYLALSFLQTIKPEWFVSYTDDASRLTAMCISIVLSFLGISLSIGAFLKAFEEKNAYNNELLKKLSDINMRLEELSVRDALTGVFNRRYLLEELESIIAKSNLQQDPLSLLMIDLDLFKDINDNYGHVYGDWVLSEVCETIKKGMRSTDFLARYGGEEFVVVLPHTSLRDASCIAERIRKLVSEIKTRESITISISIGVAQYQSQQSITDLIQSADACLYQAKHDGRNMVVAQDADQLSF